MPWKRALYPKDWPQIRARIQARAKNRCELCRVRNHAVGYRDGNGVFVPNGGNLVCDASGIGQHPSGEPLSYAEAKEFTDHYNDCEFMDGRYCDGDGNHWIVIVLTIAHKNEGGPLNCPDEDLAALCQRCHNRMDASMRAGNAAATRARKKYGTQAGLSL